MAISWFFWVGLEIQERKSFRCWDCKIHREVLQNIKLVKYEIEMKKIMSPGGTTVGLANGLVLADEKNLLS